MKKKLPQHITITDSGTYRVRYRKLNKFPISYDKTFDTIEMAIEKNNEYIARNTLKMYGQIKRIGFCDCCDYFMEWYRNRLKKPGTATVRTYLKYINVLNIDINDIHPILITEILNNESKGLKRNRSRGCKK